MDRIDRHKAIINFLAQFDEYKLNNNLPVFKIYENGIVSKDIPPQEIYKSVILLCDLFNLQGGSIGDLNLYNLLEAYISFPDSRKRFNVLAEQILQEKFDSTS